MRKNKTKEEIIEELKSYRATEVNGVWTGFRDCPECGEQIKYTANKRSDLLHNIRHINKKNCCCLECGRKKQKQTNLDLYGFESPLQNKEVQEKIKVTNLLIYGFENVFQNEEVKNKIKKTNIKKYGFACTSQNKEVKEKQNQTNIERYGFINVFQNEEIKSTWTYNRNGKDLTLQNKNETKWQAVRDFGDEIITLIDKPQILEFCQKLIIK